MGSLVQLRSDARYGRLMALRRLHSVTRSQSKPTAAVLEGADKLGDQERKRLSVYLLTEQGDLLDTPIQ